MESVILYPGREKSLLRQHPWVFTGAIRTITGNPGLGETVVVQGAKGEYLGLGSYSPHSQIAVRLWTTVPNRVIDREFLAQRLDQALAGRAGMGDLSALRLVNAESDLLPGFVVDRYGDFLVCHFLTAGAEFWKADLIELLAERVPVKGIYERSDVEVRVKEGLPLRAGVLAGIEPPPLIEIQEGGVRFLVDLCQGHKTGFYLDQRINRALLGQYSADKEVLNCFSYTGGFGVWALKGGATHLTNIDTSAIALDLAAQNLALNGFAPEQTDNMVGDVFTVLRLFRDSRRQFDLIVLDPPKFAESRGQVERAARGYKDINLLAFKLLRPGGFLFTFSCSGLVEPQLFQKIVADSALDAHREAQILQRLSQSPDHPVALPFPEGEYLKGFICRVG